jgi:hypothetical protein
MIYLEETFNLNHASWEALDNFIDFSQQHLVPICQEVGARLTGAWSSDEEWFCQVKQVMEFDDIEALKAFRITASQHKGWGEYAAGLEEQAPVRRSCLLEPLENVPQYVSEAITESAKTPNYGYLFAILEVAQGKMDQFKEALAGRPKDSPIIACWRPISGSPNQVIDVWKAPEPSRTAYQPVDDGGKQFFRQVRDMAPKERAIRMVALPYSPLK